VTPSVIGPGETNPSDATAISETPNTVLSSKTFPLNSYRTALCCCRRVTTSYSYECQRTNSMYTEQKTSKTGSFVAIEKFRHQ